MEYITNSPEETEAIGAALAEALEPGAVIAYRGDLGAGKTAFTRGLARGLGYTDSVTSPTYTIVNEYLGGRLPLFHFDMYRLRSADDLWDIGWEDYLDRGGVCAVERSDYRFHCQAGRYNTAHYHRSGVKPRHPGNRDTGPAFGSQMFHCSLPEAMNQCEHHNGGNRDEDGKERSHQYDAGKSAAANCILRASADGR